MSFSQSFIVLLGIGLSLGTPGVTPTEASEKPLSHRMFKSVRVFLWSMFFAGAGAIAAGSMTSSEVERTLGDLREGNRLNAIASLARGGQIRSPLSGSDGAIILQGTTQGARAASIRALAPLFKTDLSGQDAEAILGPEATLSKGNRLNAIAALARAKRFGPSLGEDAALALKGTTQGGRAAAIAKIAPYLRTGMPGQSIAAILGGASLLSEGNRYNAIAALNRAGRLRQFLSASEVAPILDGTTQGARAAAIGRIAKVIAAGLSGEDVSAILGKNGELTEGNRYNAIAALVRAGKLRAGLSGDEMVLILLGTSGQTRAAAIARITVAAKRQSASQQASSVATNQPSAATTAPCDAPYVAIDKPSPTCRERWQTAIFRAAVPAIFFTNNEYIDKWQTASDTGERLVELSTKFADLAMFANSVMKIEDGAVRAARILTKGNSLLLMMGFEVPEQTLGVTLAREAVDTMRSTIEAMVQQQLLGSVNPMVVVPKVVRLANLLLAYANTVRYSRLRNTYTVALEYLRLLYRMGGDQAAFARSLGLSANASVRDCVAAVNKKSIGFPIGWTDASAYNPKFAEKVVNYWMMAISEYAALKAQ